MFFAQIMMGLATEHGEGKTVMIYAAYLFEGPPHRDQHGRQKRGRVRLIGRTKGGINTKLHAVCDSQRCPLDLFVTADQVSDYIGARALLGSLPNVDWLFGDIGYSTSLTTS